MSLERCRIVLVRPHFPGNLGAAARVMHNMGLHDLALVEPIADPLDPQALRMSTHAEFVLRQARVFPTLAEAIADRVFVAGTSAQHGGLFRRQAVGSPEFVVAHMMSELAADQPTAIVFGPEPSGLTDEEVKLCHRLIVIPTGESHSSLNLAQAVAICVYELGKQWAATTPAESEMSEEPASVEMQERAFDRLRESLERIHFLYGDKAESLMHGIRHMLRKARLTAAECRILMGMARQIQWKTDQSDPPI